MNALRWERCRPVVAGAVGGGLIWSGLEVLGFWGALKSDLYVGPLAVCLALGALAGAYPAIGRALWGFAAALVLVIFIVSYTPLARALVSPMVRADAAAGKLDAIVVLSGGVTADDAMSSETLDRLVAGVEAARATGAGALVLSREVLLRSGRWVSDSADEAAVLALMGVTLPTIKIDSAASTRDEALRLKRATGAASWKRIGLVTSPLHSKRACAVFERVGFAVTCIPSISRDRSIRNLDNPGDRLRAFQGWFYETAGTVDYRMKGWI